MPYYVVYPHRYLLFCQAKLNHNHQFPEMCFVKAMVAIQVSIRLFYFSSKFHPTPLLSIVMYFSARSAGPLLSNPHLFIVLDLTPVLFLINKLLRLLFVVPTITTRLFHLYSPHPGAQTVSTFKFIINSLYLYNCLLFWPFYTFYSLYHVYR